MFRSATRHVSKIARRSLWTGVTVKTTNMASALEHIQIPHRPNVCVAMVSTCFQSQDHDALIQHVRASQPDLMLGCVVDSVGHDHGVSLWFGNDVDVKGFRVNDSLHRPKVRTVSVGRWGRVDLPTLKNVDWNKVDDVSRPTHTEDLPSALLESRKEPSMIFMASDNEPDHLLRALDDQFPNAIKVGLVGALTPFVTGRPFTLFYDNETLGAGIVGFAAYDRPPPRMHIDHQALELLGKPMTITRCRGNIILDADDQGATGLLLDLLNQRKNVSMSKDEIFYVGIYPSSSETDEEQMFVARVMSGDPSRGHLAIDTAVDLRPGQMIQFMQLSSAPTLSLHDKLDASSLNLSVLPKHDHWSEPTSSPLEIHPTAVLSSEEGIIVGRPGQPSHIVHVPWSTVTLS